MQNGVCSFKTDYSYTIKIIELDTFCLIYSAFWLLAWIINIQVILVP
jgi:hypothetical protein